MQIIQSQQVIKKVVNMLFRFAYGISLLIVSFLVLQIFCFSTFRIPSDSMDPGLEPGDNILVLKPIVGARVFNIFASLRNEQTAIYRLPGLREVRRNDVLVFNFPCPNNWDTVEMHILKYYVKRCVGLPGDSLSIRDGLFRINGFQGEIGDKASQERIGRRDRGGFEDGVFYSFPYDSVLGWNIQHFGPLYIPRSGDSIPMNRTHFLLYKKLIEWEQQASLSYKDSCVYLDHMRLDTYRFLKDYYFMAGDNGENSQDSRYWGLLPEEYIVGKAWMIWKSVDTQTDKIRWERLFTRIH